MSRQKLVLFGLLGLLMLVTRLGHFGSAISLPDASWAVFFLGGCCGGGLWTLLIFLCVAAGADVAALGLGVSDYCVTPGYWTLAPTYAALWLAGAWAVPGSQMKADRHSDFPTLAGLPRVASLLAAGVVTAFVISNVGFYVYSGYFGAMPLSDYATRVVHYLPSYLAVTFLYAALWIGLHALWKQRHRALRAA